MAGFCFNLYKWILPFLPAHSNSNHNQEDDILSVTNTVSPIDIHDDTVDFPEDQKTKLGKTNWYEMCASSLAMMVARFLQVVRGTLPSISLSNNLKFLYSSFHKVETKLMSVHLRHFPSCSQNVGRTNI